MTFSGSKCKWAVLAPLCAWWLCACGGTASQPSEPTPGPSSSSSSSNSSSSTGSSSSSSSSGGSTLNTGLGSIAYEINPASFGCAVDNGTWVYNAGIVEPAIDGCDPDGDYNGVPIGTPTKLYPQLTTSAQQAPTAAHRWWGSVAFYGEMGVGDSARSGYLTPDPLAVRITNKGARLAGIANALTQFNEDDFGSEVPDPFAEVHEGLAIANSLHGELDAKMHDYSDGSVTVQWSSRSTQTKVMQATFVHGSPYAFFTVFDGQPLLRTFSPEGPQKSVFYSSGNTLGISTKVSGINNHFLIVGEGDTEFAKPSAAETAIHNAAKAFTVVLLPHTTGDAPAAELINLFQAPARNEIAKLKIDYQVDDTTQNVTVSHRYLDSRGEPVDTLAGLMPLHWKNSNQPLTKYKLRSARGMVRFARTSGFDYQLPFVGVLPALPSDIGDYDKSQLRALVTEFVSQGEGSWNTAIDTYWSGKNYGKVAELAAIARAANMPEEANRLTGWLKAELEDWFNAYSSGTLDTTKYFAYDEHWNTLLGVDESFGAHQQLNDHHFHYGYFVRAAAEICRVEKAWCSDEAYGPMVELLIRDYAAGRNDAYFPYLRHFDPANGFSWASGHANFTRGNNNESTSEAANAYGAMILYGLITEREHITERGIYLHASSTATYWEYWNNLERYRGLEGDYDNFPASYDKITTSIIWGNGAAFATWFSAARAHILGIQGLPLNPLVLHIGLHADYLADYIALGLSESANGLPSGLAPGKWRDVWWNVLAMADGDTAVSDLESMNFNYTPEEGETKAHTYHWVHTMQALGIPELGKGGLTANYPAATAFTRNGVTTYVAYNYSESEIRVTYSDGTELNVAANSFAVKQ